MFQAITARAKRKCPTCGRNALERRIGTGAGILFKGSDFYQTDYRSESYTKAHKAETAGGESKPAPDKPAQKPDSGTAKTDGAAKPSSSDAA